MLNKKQLAKDTYRPTLEKLSLELQAVEDIRNTCKVVFDSKFNITNKSDLAQIRNANISRLNIRKRLREVCIRLNCDGILEDMLRDYKNLEELYNNYMYFKSTGYIRKEA
jgi:hypothetical protein